MSDIESKLKKAKEGDHIYDPKTGVSYEVAETSKKGGMPLTIARGGSWCTA